MKKVLIVSTVASMIGQFNIRNIKILQDLKFEVHIACNFEDKTVWNENRIKLFKEQLKEIEVQFFQIDFTRNVMKLYEHKKSYFQLIELINNNHYEFIHCHTPIASVITRMVTHRKGIKCIYTAHGFHFFNGAPKKNWIIYYPIEKFFSKWTDVLITINSEDYLRAQKNFYVEKVIRIPGVGIDTEQIQSVKIDSNKIRKELNIPSDAFLLLSVGELQARKNQRIIIEAMHKLENDNIYYLIVGQGELQQEYRQLIKEYHLENNIRLLGYRQDIIELCKSVDCFVHPSVREGLGIAPLEAMASGLPLISSYVNGIRDYTEDGVTGICIKNPLSVDEMKKAIEKLYKDSELRHKCGEVNKKIVLKYDNKITDEIMRQVYLDISRGDNNK